MRLATNLVLPSSSERTRAPSVLLLTSSYRPDKPVTPMILLYSIAVSFKGRARYCDLPNHGFQDLQDLDFPEIYLRLGTALAAWGFEKVEPKRLCPTRPPLAAPAPA